MLVSFLMIIVDILCVLMAIAFVTLFERHVLSISQLRFGPNKVVFMGILQPVLDGIKLLFKESIFLSFYSSFFYWFFPAFSLLLMFLMWVVLPKFFSYLSLGYSALFYICCVGLMVYAILFSGLSSHNKYSYIGGVRGVSQSISYEVVYVILIIGLVFVGSGMFFSFAFSFGFFLLFGIIFFVCVLAEANRAPFDFAEGESELVSGFNTEYCSVGFVLLFLSEYGAILMMSCLFSVLFLYQPAFMFFVFMLILLIRSVYPRLRYDWLMSFLWFAFLPVSIFLLSVVVFSFVSFFS